MIEFKKIQKSFDGKVVLDDISHVMETGKANLIIGQSGSGKTVLQKCLVGLFEPDEGEIIFDGKKFDPINDRVPHGRRAPPADRHALPGFGPFRQHDRGAEYHVPAGHVHFKKFFGQT